MSEPTKPEISEEEAQRAKYMEDFKKQYPDLELEPDGDFLGGTREERMERMRKRVDAVAKYFKEGNAHAPIPGTTEPWWMAFINYESDLRETVDEKTREELNVVTKTMFNAGLTPEAISEARDAAEKIMVGYPEMWERVKQWSFNEESLGKMRTHAEKNVAEGKGNPFPFLVGNIGAKSEAKDEEVVETLD
ncbi:hypothetical protein B0T16DRAFT_386295 [Cercophora newfieldiana]|uniref:Uncharacterized protein n=1 Tax=Cercophora newfieldiana TaxID=92897 RepID=A0AA39YSI5_9PEZI|nr:hypothetical protein B0T16DRAFT_386295 [Cercophora newfieldiana]